eukprot:6162980-Pyramimonas_sp.AAC.4
MVSCTLAPFTWRVGCRGHADKRIFRPENIPAAVDAPDQVPTAGDTPPVRHAGVLAHGGRGDAGRGDGDGDGRGVGGRGDRCRRRRPSISGSPRRRHGQLPGDRDLHQMALNDMLPE